MPRTGDQCGGRAANPRLYRDRRFKPLMISHAAPSFTPLFTAGDPKWWSIADGTASRETTSTAMFIPMDYLFPIPMIPFNRWAMKHRLATNPIKNRNSPNRLSPYLGKIGNIHMFHFDL